MTKEEIINVFEEKIAELNSFLGITPNPEETYGNSVRLCDAMKLACDIARDSSAEQMAAFRLGQMDMRMSASAAIKDTAPSGECDCRTCTMETAYLVESLEVI